MERHLLLPQPTIAAGDILLGIPSSGLHSNGFSLVRKIVNAAGLTYASPCPWDAKLTLGQALLEPTRIYINALLPAVRLGLLKGMSHITGGGFTENIPRVLPKGLGCYVDASTWTRPPVFKFLMEHGNVSPLEMARTFNNGIGMVIVVSPGKLEDAINAIKATGEREVHIIGQVSDTAGVDMRGLHTWSGQ